MISDDTPLYVYGLMPGELAGHAPLAEVLADCNAVGGGPVDILCHDDMAALVSRHTGEEILQTRRNMMAHTKVLEAALTAGTLLPMRFGAVAGNRVQLTRFLAASADEIARQMGRIDGCIEIGVRVQADRGAAFAAITRDRPELVERQRALAARGADAHFERIDFGRKIAEDLDGRRKSAERRLVEQVAPWATAHVVKTPEEDTDILRAAFLVTREGEADFLAALDRYAPENTFAPGHPVQVNCIGPAPAYHFVDLSLTLNASDEVSEVA